jgi:hypothetical protein
MTENRDLQIISSPTLNPRSVGRGGCRSCGKSARESSAARIPGFTSSVNGDRVALAVHSESLKGNLRSIH